MPDAKLQMSERELQILAAAWECQKSEPQIDYEKMANVAGFKNKASASACTRPVLKKLTQLYPLPTPANSGGASSSGPTGVAKRTNPVRKSRAQSKTAGKKAPKGVSDEIEKTVPGPKPKMFGLGKGKSGRKRHSTGMLTLIKSTPVIADEGDDNQDNINHD